MSLYNARPKKCDGWGRKGELTGKDGKVQLGQKICVVKDLLSSSYN